MRQNCAGLLSLPNELLIIIIELSRDHPPWCHWIWNDNKTFQSLSLTNRRLRSIAQPLIYHRTRLSSFTDMVCLLRTLVEKPELRGHVRELQLEKFVWFRNDSELFASDSRGSRYRIGVPREPFLLLGDSRNRSCRKEEEHLLTKIWRAFSPNVRELSTFDRRIFGRTGLVPHPFCIKFPQDLPQLAMATLLGLTSNLQKLQLRLPWARDREVKDWSTFTQVFGSMLDDNLIGLQILPHLVDLSLLEYKIGLFPARRLHRHQAAQALFRLPGLRTLSLAADNGDWNQFGLKGRLPITQLNLSGTNINGNYLLKVCRACPALQALRIRYNDGKRRDPSSFGRALLSCKDTLECLALDLAGGTRQRTPNPTNDTFGTLTCVPRLTKLKSLIVDVGTLFLKTEIMVSSNLVELLPLSLVELKLLDYGSVDKERQAHISSMLQRFCAFLPGGLPRLKRIELGVSSWDYSEMFRNTRDLLKRKGVELELNAEITFP